MTKKSDELLKKKEAIMICSNIINIPKYKVVGHGAYEGNEIPPLLTPKETTNILVIYLKK